MRKILGGPVGSNQPLMPRCFAAVEFCHLNSAAVPSVRNTGVHESKALQVVTLRPLSLLTGVPGPGPELGPGQLTLRSLAR
jgi:hypothetical protein